MTGYIQFTFPAGASIDFTLRVGGPQIERGSYASGLILPPPGEWRVSARGAGEELQERGPERLRA